MTHFCVGIIVPESELADLDAFITSQMDPYDENREVESYVAYSVEQAAFDLQSEITRYKQIIRRNEANYDIDRCCQRLRELLRMTPEQKYRERLRGFEDFDEAGRPISTYNPAAKWDWYRIGGRWDGWITGNVQESDGGFNFGRQHETVANNSATTEQVLARDTIPHALVTPEGQWHERGRLGCFGLLRTENEDWEPQARKILARYPGHHVVLLDAHL
jgi:hypothetical protein